MKYKVILLLIPLIACLYGGPKWKKYNFVWEKQYDFNRKADIAEYAVTSKKGDLFVLGSGRKKTDIDMDGGHNIKMYWILKKFSPKSKEDIKKWNKEIEIEIEINFFDSEAHLAIDRNDNIYVVGKGYGSLDGQRCTNWWVKRYSPDGKEDAEHWGDKIIRNDSLYILSSIDVDNKNNLYVGGRDRVEIEEVRDTGDKEELWWVKKYNEYGIEDENWNKKNDNGNNDSLSRIAVDKKNNVYLSGIGSMAAGGKRGSYSWIRKYNENGVEDKNWNKRFGFDQNLIYSIIILIDSNNNNNVYVVGTFRDSSNYDDTLCIKKFSEDGVEDESWDKKYIRDNGFDLNSAAIDKYDNIYVAGYGYNLVAVRSGFNMWIRKIGFDGKEDMEKWDKKIDNNEKWSMAHGIAIDIFNDVYVVGEGADLVAQRSEKEEDMLRDPN
ncbi:MAG: hypothetical protein FWG13_06515, partial [Leptospirales bacterium]|nr:hypothetical protein [Leptospirales bacterium]